ncbi:hypothetical protein HBA54_04185 [Pelagibius litoralis]|uniref:Uncharacterized protein n=1 Tax=Pelagibius litoralis TaxID=374515 RepID=A0A967C5G7_9PROT|nr:hypothetical protein [Pelagibius litoralis]NIA67781.1 hypothetical protein [Pelagibius litoralis]
MRIPSGVTDQFIYFVAVDATDLKTRETALSSFTVYRSRNGAAAAAMTTPTVNETDATNMPGVYELLLDEDMSIASGNDSEEMVFHITHAGMAPVTRTIELYRPKITAGETLTVSSGNGNSAVQSIAANAITESSINTAAITANKIAANSIGASELAGDAVSEIQSGLATAAALAAVDTNVDAILVDTGTTIPAQITGLNDPTAAAIADAVWDEAQSGHVTAGSFGEIATEIAAILADTGTDGVVISSATANAIAAALLDLANGIETGVTLRQAQRIQLSSAAGKLSGAATTSIAIRDVGDSKDRITATVDANGNRSAVTLDAT